MFKIIVTAMDMADVWIIVCALCWFSLIEAQTVYIAENKTDWSNAFQTCKRLSGRLPFVTVSDHQLELQDLVGAKNISSPFWVSATYDLSDNASASSYGYVYPNICCERIAIVSGKQEVTCGDCLKYQSLVCATSNSDIYIHPTFIDAIKWDDALYDCTNRQMNLPKRDNAGLLNITAATKRVFWLDGIRKINLTPNIGIQNRTCLHSFNGTIHEENCYNTSITTVCILETNYTISTGKPGDPMQPNTITDETIALSPSLPTSFEYPNTDVGNVIVYTTGMKSTPELSITKTQISTVSTNFEVSSYTNVLDSTSKSTEKISETPAKGIWPILGGVLGGFFAVMVVVIVTIIILRIRRMKNDPEKVLNYAANNKPATKIKLQTNLSYDSAVGESFALEAQIATSSQLSTAQEEEPVIYSQPQKVKTNCENLMDDQFRITQTTDENENTGLYSMVQNRQKTHGISNKLIKDEVHDKDYYDISFTEPGKGNAVENIYNKANFHHPGCDEELTVNMYDKANFLHEVLETETGNEYHKANFHHEMLETNTGNE